MAITYTLGGLKALIADDIARSDLSTQIENAIEHAIGERQEERFFFNETRTASFDTVASQSSYSSSDDTDIPLFYEVDGLILEDSDGNRFDLGEPEDPVQMHILLGTGSASGQPVSYTYFDEAFVFYPIPDAAYTITPIGHIEIAAPATDGEADNPWVSRRGAFQLIRADAKAYLYAHVIKDTDQAAIAVDAAQGALAKLRSRTSRKRATGQIQPTAF